MTNNIRVDRDERADQLIAACEQDAKEHGRTLLEHWPFYASHLVAVLVERIESLEERVAELEEP